MSKSLYKRLGGVDRTQQCPVGRSKVHLVVPAEAVCAGVKAAAREKAPASEPNVR